MYLNYQILLQEKVMLFHFLPTMGSWMMFPFIDFFSRYTTCAGEINIVFPIHLKKTIFAQNGCGTSDAVSYTHLDVYKRQHE